MSIFVAAVSAAVAVAAPLTGVPLLVSQARADYFTLKRDQFAARTLKDAAAGTPFTITLRPQNGDASSGKISNDSFYSYQDGKLELQISASTVHAPPSPSPDDRYIEVVNFLTVNRSTGRHVGTNAYGASVVYDSRSVQSSGIALIGGGGLRLVWTRALDGPAAKAVALGSRFVLHGIIARLPSGHVGDCSTDHAAATVESPTEALALSCYVGGVISQVDLIGPSGLLKTWEVPSVGGIPSPTESATAKGDPRQWVTSDDYPTGETLNGVTRAHLKVSSSGLVSDCTIAESSGSARLDEQACMLLRRRGRFTPAKNLSGDSVESTMDVPVVWERPNR